MVGPKAVDGHSSGVKSSDVGLSEQVRTSGQMRFGFVKMRVPIVAMNVERDT